MLLKRRVKERAGNVCERCHSAPVQDIHHITYIRAYFERLEDLQGLCRPCHEYVSAKNDTDPLDELDKKAKQATIDFRLSCQRVGIDQIKGGVQTVHEQLQHLLPNIAPFIEKGKLVITRSVDGKKVEVELVFPYNESVAYQWLKYPMKQIPLLDALRKIDLQGELIMLSVRQETKVAGQAQAKEGR